MRKTDEYLIMEQKILTSFSAYLKHKNFINIRPYSSLKQSEIKIQKPEDKQSIKPDLSAENNGITYFYKVLARQSLTVEGLYSFCKSFNEKYHNKPSVKLKLLVPVQKSDALLQWLNRHQFENIGIIRVQPQQLSN